MKYFIYTSDLIEYVNLPLDSELCPPTLEFSGSHLLSPIPKDNANYIFSNKN